MTTSFDAKIRERVLQIETMPAIPAVFLPLLKLLSNSAMDSASAWDFEPIFVDSQTLDFRIERPRWQPQLSSSA